MTAFDFQGLLVFFRGGEEVEQEVVFAYVGDVVVARVEKITDNVNIR